MRALLTSAMLCLGSALAVVGTAVGCSSSSSPGSEGSGGKCDGAACQDTGITADSQGGATDAGVHEAAGDGPHDSAAPDALYGACARMGSFGWPCSASTSGP